MQLQNTNPSSKCSIPVCSGQFGCLFSVLSENNCLSAAARSKQSDITAV